MKVMQIEAQDSFFKSLKRLSWHQSPVYKTYRLFRYGLPGFIKNVWRFRRELWSHRWWDYRFTLEMFKKSVEIQYIGMKDKGIEVEHSLNKKLKKMERVLELLNNKIQDTYLSSVEAKYGEMIMKDWNFEEDESGRYMLVDEDTEEEKAHNRMIIKKAHDIEQAEWKELWQIIEGKKYKEYKDYDGSDLRAWWD